MVKSFQNKNSFQASMQELMKVSQKPFLSPCYVHSKEKLFDLDSILLSLSMCYTTIKQFTMVGCGNLDFPRGRSN